jgi:Glycosyl transferase family group 2
MFFLTHFPMLPKSIPLRHSLTHRLPSTPFATGALHPPSCVTLLLRPSSCAPLSLGTERRCRWGPGTNFLIRAAAFREAGWSPEYTLTEDFALGMVLKMNKWHCRYVEEYLAVGEAPEQVRNCFQQRSRWCKVGFLPPPSLPPSTDRPPSPLLPFPPLFLLPCLTLPALSL